MCLCVYVCVFVYTHIIKEKKDSNLRVRELGKGFGEGNCEGLKRGKEESDIILF